jgi:ERCC4-type nuclease
MVIMVYEDSREQRPLFLDCARVVRKLDVGDYTTSRLLNKVHVERKSPQDFYGTLVQGHSRFKREMLRAFLKGTRLVVFVECSKADFISKRWPQGHNRLMTSDVLAKIVETMEVKHRLEIVWCESRKHCENSVLEFLKAEEAKLG